MSDRTVHARYAGWEVVRYDRAGRWWLEPTPANVKRVRRPLTLDEAVKAARWGVKHAGGEIFHGLPGGQTFDRRTR